jgi:hypothetical protein
MAEPEFQRILPAPLTMMSCPLDVSDNDTPLPDVREDQTVVCIALVTTTFPETVTHALAAPDGEKRQSPALSF